MIKCGIIGFGKMGQIRAAAIENSGLGVVELIYDEIDLESKKYNQANSIDELINSDNIDAVFICTPNFLIPQLCIKAIENGKHVFSEKPPGFNALDVIEVRKTLKNKSNIKLMYGFNHRYHESIMLMKKIVDEKSFGNILWMRGRYGKEVDNSYFNNWRANPKIAGAGILLDQGIHMVDLMIHMSGVFDKIHAFISNTFWNIPGIEDNVFSILKNSKTGVTASIHSTMTQWRYLFSLEIFLEGGSLILNGLKTSSGAYGDEILSIKPNLEFIKNGKFESEQTLQFHIDNSWDYETKHFLSAIIYDTKIEQGTVDHAIDLMIVIDKIYESGKINNENTK